MPVADARKAAAGMQTRVALLIVIFGLVAVITWLLGRQHASVQADARPSAASDAHAAAHQRDEHAATPTPGDVHAQAGQGDDFGHKQPQRPRNRLGDDVPAGMGDAMDEIHIDLMKRMILSAKDHGVRRQFAHVPEEDLEHHIRAMKHVP
jgi:hypothetical protein